MGRGRVVLGELAGVPVREGGRLGIRPQEEAGALVAGRFQPPLHCAEYAV